MFITIKMFIGLLFSLGLAVFALYKKNGGWLITALIGFLGSIIFIGQFILSIGE